MDNQEAIRLIRNLPTMCEFTDAYGEPIDSDAYYEAVEMAISALEAQELSNNSPKLDSDSGEWVPVSKRFPDDLEEVNVTWVNHDPEPYYAFIKDKPATASAVYYKGEWYWYSSVCGDILAEYGRNDTDKVDDAIEITAWQPLPEPYQEESV